MMKRLVCAVAAVGLIVTTCFSHLSAFAESKDGNLVIDLNASEDCEKLCLSGCKTPRRCAYFHFSNGA